MTHPSLVYHRCEAAILLSLVVHASADDGHEIIEHLHPEVRGMVRDFLQNRADEPVQPSVDLGPLYTEADLVPDRIALIPLLILVLGVIPLGVLLGMAIGALSGLWP